MSAPLLGWRHAGASVAGTAHLRQGLPCQDHTEATVLRPGAGGDVLVAVAADGAGSAARSAEGARLVCRAFLDFAAAAPWRLDDPGLLDDGFPSRALAAVRDALDAHAHAEGEPARAFACTLLAAVVGEDAALFLQLGDGAVVFRAGDDLGWQLALPPARGEFHNETAFVTGPEALRHLGVRRVTDRVLEVALMTDGVEFLAVQQARGAPHGPFLDHVLAELHRAPPGLVPAHADWLDGFLHSEAVCRRTDDDKTLLLASRAAAPAP